MTTILLTGATGFIGSHLLESLLSNQYKVIIIKRTNSDTWRIEHLLSKVTVYNIDIDSMESIFEDNPIDIIVHLATLYRKFDNGFEVNEMMESNVSFPVQLIEAGLRHHIKGFINTGTFFEYDCSQVPVSEETKISPFNLYARSKIALESILETYADDLTIKTFRLFTPYGTKDNQKIIPMIIKKTLAGEKIELSDGLQKLDFINVNDIVDAYLKGIEKMVNESTGYDVYNIGTGVSTSIRDVVDIIENGLGVEANKVWGDSPAPGSAVVRADISKAQQILGWIPKVSLVDGIKETIKYYKEEKL